MKTTRKVIKPAYWVEDVLYPLFILCNFILAFLVCLVVTP